LELPALDRETRADTDLVSDGSQNAAGGQTGAPA
jgi:hypothetical protein